MSQQEDVQQKTHSLFDWNMQPLSFEERKKSPGNGKCPACGLPRFAMLEAMLPFPFVSFGKCCTCPVKGEHI